MGTFTGEKDSRNIVKKAKSGYYTRPNTHKNNKDKNQDKVSSVSSSSGSNAPIGQTYQSENKEGKYLKTKDTSRSIPSFSDFLSVGMQTIKNNLIAADKTKNAYNFNIQNKNVLQIGQIPKVDLTGGNKDYKTPSDRYKANGRRYFSSYYVGQGNPVADFLHDMSFANNNNSLLMAAKGSNKKIADVDSEVTGDFGKARKMFLDYTEGKLQHFATEEEYKKYEKEYKDWEERHKDKDGNIIYTTEAPPIGKRKDGSKVDKKEWEKAWRLNYAVEVSDKMAIESAEKRMKERNSMTASFEDTKQNNSIADVIIDSSKHNKSVPGSTLNGAFGVNKYNKDNLLSGLFKYHSDYIFKPLIKGEYTVLLNNVLVNLGETLDLTAKGYKGFLYGSQGIYGKKNGMSQLDDKDSQWVYKGDSSLSEDERKAVQKKLIKLGILDYINGSAGTKLGGAGSNENKQSLNEFLKAKGLKKEERNKFLKEAKIFISSYKKFQKSDNAPGHLANISKAYSTKQRYDIETGEVGLDLLLETVSDPTLLVGVLAGAGKSAVKSTTKGIIRENIGKILNRADDFDISSFVVKKDPIIDQYTKEYGRLFADDLLYKSAKEIEQDAKGLSYQLLKHGLLRDKTESDHFASALAKSINFSSDNFNFKIINSLKNIDTVADQIDRAFLKGVFDLPYFTVKGVKPVLRKLNMSSKKARFFDRRAVGKIRKYCANEITGDLDIFSVDDVQLIKETDAVAQDVNIDRKVNREIHEHTINVISDLNKIIDDTVHIDGLYDRLDNYVVQAYGNKVSSFEEFVNYVKEQPMIYGLEVRKLVDAAERVQDRATSVVKTGKIDFDNNIINRLSSVPSGSDDTLADVFDTNVELYLNTIASSSLKRRVVEIQMNSSAIEDPLIKDDYLTVAMNELSDEFRSKSLNHSNKLTGEIKSTDLDEYRVIDNKMTLPVYGDFSTSLGSANTAFFNKCLSLKFPPKNHFKTLFKYLESSGVEVKLKKEAVEGLDYVDNFMELHGTDYMSFKDFRALVVEDFADDYIYSDSVYSYEDLINPVNLSKQEFYEKYPKGILKYEDFWKEYVKRMTDNTSKQEEVTKEIGGSVNTSKDSVINNFVNKDAYEELKNQVEELLQKKDNPYLASDISALVDDFIRDKKVSLDDVKTKIYSLSEVDSDLKKQLEFFFSISEDSKKMNVKENDELRDKLINEAISELIEEPLSSVKNSTNFGSNYTRTEAETIADENLFKRKESIGFKDFKNTVYRAFAKEYLDGSFIDAYVLSGKYPKKVEFKKRGQTAFLPYAEELAANAKYVTAEDLLSSENLLSNKRLFKRYSEDVSLKQYKASHWLEHIKDRTPDTYYKNEFGFMNFGSFKDFKKTYRHKIVDDNLYKEAFKKLDFGDAKKELLSSSKIMKYKSFEKLIQKHYDSLPNSVQKRYDFYRYDLYKEYVSCFKEYSQLAHQKLYTDYKAMISLKKKFSDELYHNYFDDFEVYARQYKFIKKEMDAEINRMYNGVKSRIDVVNNNVSDAFGKFISDRDYLYKTAYDAYKAQLGGTGSAYWQFYSKRKELNNQIGKLYSSFLKRRKSYLPNATVEGLDKLSQVEVIDMLREGIESIQFGIAVKKGKNEGLTKTDKFNLKLVKYAKDLEYQLRMHNDANTILSAEQSFSKLHEDIAHRFFRIIDDPLHERLSSIVNSSTLFGKYYAVMDSSFVGLFDANLDTLNLTKDQRKHTIKLLKAFTAFSGIVNKASNYSYFRNLMNELSTNTVGLDIKKQSTIIDTLFGSQAKSASFYKNVNSTNMNSLINKINAGLQHRYGEERVSLDAFRDQITDYNSPVYKIMSERFGDMVYDEKIQNRISTLCEEGHLNPVNDVRVTLLQSIVYDKHFIQTMNGYSVGQPVFIMDIETTGMRAYRSDLTDIAYYRWEYLNDDSDIETILNYIENADIKRQHVSLPEEEIRRDINPSTLEALYRRDPKHRSFKQQLEDYVERYGSKNSWYEGYGAVVTEKDLIESFTKVLDDAAHSMNDSVPKLVVHNSNGFDLDFFYQKCSNPDYQIYPQHIDSWDVLFDESYNTLAKIVGIRGDNILSNSQERFVRELVSKYARSLPHAATMRPLELRGLYKDIQEFIQYMEEVQEPVLLSSEKLEKIAPKNIAQKYKAVMKKLEVPGGVRIKNRASKSISELPNDANTVEDILSDQSLFNELKLLKEDLEEAIARIYDEDVPNNTFSKNVFLDNPFESGYKQDSLLKQINKNVESDLYAFGYKNVYDAQTTMRYFEIKGKELDYHTLMRMSDLSVNIKYDVEYRMKQNSIVHNEDVISYSTALFGFAKRLGSRVDIFDEFSYLKYLKLPEDDYELFDLAQILYNRFTENYVHPQIIDELKNKPYKALNYKERNILSDWYKFGEEFYYTFASFDLDTYFKHAFMQYEIYKDAPMDVALKYLNMPSEDEKYALTLANGLKNGIYSLRMIQEGSIAAGLTETHNMRLGTINSLMTNAADLFTRIGSMPDKDDLGEATRRCISEGIKAVEKKRQELFDIQILNYVSKNEENLISHLLHHNQILVVPSNGTAMHQALFNALKRVVKGADPTKINYLEKQGYLFVSIDRRWENKLEINKDAGNKWDAPEMYFGSENKAYLPPQYKRIVINHEEFAEVAYNSIEQTLEEMHNMDKAVELDPLEVEALLDEFLPDISTYLDEFENHIINLSGGRAVGSLGRLHDMRVQKEIYANLPPEFRANILSVEYTTNDRFYHTPSFQMSLLGDYDNCWHVAAFDVDESDALYATYDTLRRVGERASTEALIVDRMFGVNDPLSINKLFEGCDDYEVVNILKDNPEVAVVAMRNANTDSGYMIEFLDIKNTSDLKYAREIDARIISYADALDMSDLINEATSNSTLWKVWAWLANLNKVVALVKPMTAVRNAIDAYVKGTIETGDPFGYTANLIKAHNLIKEYKELNKRIIEDRGIFHATEKDIENHFDALVAGTSNRDMLKIDFATYKMLEGWMSTSRAGGESRQMLEIKKKSRRKTDWKALTKSELTGRDVIASDVAKFNMFSSDEAGRYYDQVLTDSEKNVMSKDVFLKIHAGVPSVLTPTNLSQYDMLVDSIVKNFKSNELTREGLAVGLRDVYNSFANGALKFMSIPEEVVRLAQYLTLADKGYSESLIHRNILLSQYDPATKTKPAKILETVVPFISFTKANISYWAKLIDRNPKAFRMLNHIMEQLSWNFDNFSVEDHYAMQEMVSGNINSDVFEDLIPDDIFGEDVLDGWFKLNPSYMDAFNFVWGPTSELAESLYAPLEVSLGEAYYNAGVDLSCILSADFGKKIHELSPSDKLQSAMPVWSVVKKYIDNPYSLFYTGLKFEADKFSFNSFELFQNDLAKQDKWYDMNKGKVVALSEKNEVGLNSKSLKWEDVCYYKLKFKGKVFDNNVGKFVYPSEFRPGGLNRDWDFDKEGEWEEYIKLFYKLRGKKWDNNQGRFVDPKDYIPGGLNRKWDFTKEGEWDKYCAVRKKYFPNEVWDANQESFVLKSEYIKGGLNSKDLTWSQVCALKYYLHGKVWDSDSKEWKQVTDPKVKIDVNLLSEKEAEFMRMFKKIDSSKHDSSFLNNFIDVVQAESNTKSIIEVFDDVMSGLSKSYALSKTFKDNMLTGNQDNDAKVLAGILSKAGLFEKHWGSGLEYYSGRAGEHAYKGKSLIPSKSNFVNSYYKGKGYSQKVYPKYSDPFSFANNNTGLRYSITKFPVYDTYYNYEYNKLYNYKGSKDLLGHYPLTSGSMKGQGNRFNNIYRANTYYQGLYKASSFKGLSLTLRNTVKLSSKLRQYQH